MGNLQRTSYHFSFLDVTLQVDTFFNVVHSAIGNRKVSRTELRSRRCTSPVASEFDAHTNAWDRKLTIFVFLREECSDMIMSVAAQSSALGRSKLRPKRSGWQL